MRLPHFGLGEDGPGSVKIPLGARWIPVGTKEVYDRVRHDCDIVCRTLRSRAPALCEECGTLLTSPTEAKVKAHAKRCAEQRRQQQEQAPTQKRPPSPEAAEAPVALSKRAKTQ